MKRVLLAFLMCSRFLSFSQEQISIQSSTPGLSDNLMKQDQVTVDFLEDAVTVKTYPDQSLLMDSLVLNGRGLFTEVRVVILSFNLCADDDSGIRNEACFQCYNEAFSWGGILGGILPGFTPVITSIAGSTARQEQSSFREIVFKPGQPMEISRLPMKLRFVLPGANPDDRCHLLAEITLKIIFRNNNCQEFERVIQVFTSLSETPAPIATLKDKLDGSFYPALKGRIQFKYNENYQIPADKYLKYTVYDKMYNPVTNKNIDGQIEKAMPRVTIRPGTNYIQLNLSDIAAMKENEMYTLEVQNDKNEKLFLRFIFLK